MIVCVGERKGKVDEEPGSHNVEFASNLRHRHTVGMMVTIQAALGIECMGILEPELSCGERRELTFRCECRT